jgi:hypothetical protein
VLADAAPCDGHHDIAAVPHDRDHFVKVMPEEISRFGFGALQPYMPTHGVLAPPSTELAIERDQHSLQVVRPDGDVVIYGFAKPRFGRRNHLMSVAT